MAHAARPSPPTISIVIPVLNEAEVLHATLASCVAEHAADELLVVDGGSSDATRSVATTFFAEHPAVNARWLDSARGRACQLQAGADVSQGDAVLFLHADTILLPGALAQLRAALQAGALWGRFDVRLSGRRAAFRVIESLMNSRSRLTGIATGDQAIFVRRDALRVAGGYGNLPLMEDIDLSRRLKRLARPVCLGAGVVTSSRCWERRGIVATVVCMWAIRLLFFLGVAPTRLARWYR